MKLESVLTDFDQALTAQERAGESRKAVAAAQKLIAKVTEAVSGLPEDYANVITVDHDVLTLMGQAVAPPADLAPVAKKLNAMVEVYGDAPEDAPVDLEQVSSLLTRYRALKPVSGVRDGSSKLGSRAFPGVISVEFPDGKVRNSSGDWTSIRWECRDHAAKRNTEITKPELDTVFQNLKVCVQQETEGDWTIEDDLGNEYTITYRP